MFMVCVFGQKKGNNSDMVIFPFDVPVLASIWYGDLKTFLCFLTNELCIYI